MSEVTVRANSRVLGLKRGGTARVEETDFIRTLVQSRRLSIEERHDPPAAAPELAGDRVDVDDPKAWRPAGFLVQDDTDTGCCGGACEEV